MSFFSAPGAGVESRWYWSLNSLNSLSVILARTPASAADAVTSTTRRARSLANWGWLQHESACAVSVVWPPNVRPISGRAGAALAFEPQEVDPPARSTASAGYAAALVVAG